MNYGLKFISANTLAVLLFLSIALLKGNVGQLTVLGILAVWGAYNLFVLFRHRWTKNRQSGAKPAAPVNNRPAQKPPVQAAPSAPAPAVQVVAAPPQRMVIPEVPSNYKAVMLRHINFRITQKLQGAFPNATWSWCCENPADIAASGGIARIRTFGTGDNNFAEVQFEQNGSIKVNMLQLHALGEDKKPKPAGEGKAADPDAVDLQEWYELSASSVIRATIDEVYTRGYKTLYIGESGEVYVKEDDQNVKQGKLSFMPGRKLCRTWSPVLPTTTSWPPSGTMRWLLHGPRRQGEVTEIGKDQIV